MSHYGSLQTRRMQTIPIEIQLSHINISRKKSVTSSSNNSNSTTKAETIQDIFAKIINTVKIIGASLKTSPRVKWRCPNVFIKLEDGAPCICCSPSPYGRTFYTKPEWDLCIFCKLPRGTNSGKTL